MPLRWILLLALVLLWAPSFLLIKIALEDIPALWVASGRLAIAALVLAPLMGLRGSRIPRDRRTLFNLAVMALFGSALPFVFITTGEEQASSALAAIFNGATPIATAILAHFFVAEERLTLPRVAGIVIGFGGIILIFLPAAVKGGGKLYGITAFLLAAVCYGISMVHARKNLRGLAPMVGPTMQLGMGALMLIPFALLFASDRLVVPGTAPILSLVSLAILGTAVAYIVYYRLVELSSATFLSLVTYFLPPAGVILGLIFLDESVTWNAVVGCGMIIGGVLLVNIAGRTARPEGGGS